MCTAVDVKKEKKVTARHKTLWIPRQCVTEYSEKMDVSEEQRCEIKFRVRLKKMPSETTVWLKEAFGKETLGDSMIRRGYKAFIDRQESAEFKPQGGAPQTVVTVTNINTNAAVVEEDCHLTVRALAGALHIPRDTESEDNESVVDDE